MRIHNQCINTNLHSSQLFPFCLTLSIIFSTKLFDMLLNFFFKIRKTLQINFIIQHGMSWCTLLHKFSKNTSFIGSKPLSRHLSKNPITNRPIFPKRNNIITLQLLSFIINIKRNLFTSPQNIKILKRMGTNLRKCRSCFWTGSSLTNN